MIAAEELGKSYEDDGSRVPVFQGVAFTVEQGEMVALSGPSGAGKSSLLHVLGGLDRSYEGRVRVLGKDLDRLSEEELASFRNRDVGFVFQSFNLIPPLTVLQNVLLPTHFSGVDESKAVERALEALERVGLSGKERRLPSQLSGGERQRVAIARAIFRAPKLLLADEPTGSLDAASADQVISLLRDLNEKEKTTVIVASHEPSVWQAASRRLILEGGRLQQAPAPAGGDS